MKTVVPIGGVESLPTRTARSTPARGNRGGPPESWMKRIVRIGAGALPWFWLPILGWVTGIYFITYFLLPRLPLSASGNVYIVQPALWLSLALVSFAFWHKGLQEKPPLFSYVVVVALLAGVFHIALLILAGMMAGFGHSPYGDSPAVIAKNALYVGSGVLGLELTRASLVAVFARRKSLLGLAFVTLFLALVTIPRARFMDLGSGAGGFETLGDTFLPRVSESLLASFLALVGGPLASVAYRGALEAFRWFSPILPDLNWSATAFVGTLAPALALLILRGLMVPSAARDAAKEGHRESWGLFPSGVAIVAVSLLWLSTGLLGVRPALVVGHSMEPALRTGDVVLTREVSDDRVAVGDIVRFNKGNTTVVHRVKEVYASGGTTWIVTKGDANNVNDDPITADQVDGEVLLTIPKIGWVGIFVRNAAASGLGGGGPALWVLMVVGGVILAVVALLTMRGISAWAPTKRRQDPEMAAAFLRSHLHSETALAEERPPVSPVPAPVKHAVPPAPKATPPTRSAARRRAPSPRAPTLLAVVESIGSAIGVAVAVFALWAADWGAARAIALGRRGHNARRAPANLRRVTTPAVAAAAAAVPPEPPPLPKRRPQRALILASLAATQAIGVAVAVGALWAAGAVSFSGGSGTCPNEQTTLATELEPRSAPVFDAPAPRAVPSPAHAAASEANGASRAPAVTVAPEADGSPQAPAVAAATEEPTAVATALPPITAEEPPINPEIAQPAPVPSSTVPTPEYQIEAGDTQVSDTAPPASTAAPSPRPTFPTMGYAVRPGESLSDVADFFGTTVQTILALNDLADANLVVPGQILLVPAPPANTAPGQAFTSEYVVQAGENLTDIAERFGTTVEALAAENNLANPSAIRVGDHLLVP